ncbi:MAG TPA: hypothetical protein VKD72_07345 [Gemmataceae bacterium]|nr:hypothetical protein [Gemmataceae bacterium]
MFRSDFGNQVGPRGFLGIALIGCLSFSSPGWTYATAPAPAVPDAAEREAVTALWRQLRDALRKEIKGRREAMVTFWDPYLLDATRLLLQTELALAAGPKERLALYKEYDTTLENLEKDKRRLDDRVRKGAPSPGLQAERLDARIALLREQAGKSPTAERSAEIRGRLVELREVLRKQRHAEIAWADHLRKLPSSIGPSALDGCPEGLRRRLLEVELELARTQKERLALLKTYHDEVSANFGKMKKSDKFAAFPLRDTFPTDHYATFEAGRWEAELLWLRGRIGEHKPTAEEASELETLHKKRRQALQQSIDGRRAIVEQGFSHYAARTLDVLALRLRGELEKEAAEPGAAWAEYLEGVEALDRVVKRLAKCDRGITPMVEAARLRAKLGQLRSREK